MTAKYAVTFARSARRELSRLKGDLIKSMFLFWAPTALTVVGIALGVVALLLRR